MDRTRDHASQPWIDGEIGDRPEPCPTCDGKPLLGWRTGPWGRIAVSCVDCDGTGRLDDFKSRAELLACARSWERKEPRTITGFVPFEGAYVTDEKMRGIAIREGDPVELGADDGVSPVLERTSKAVRGTMARLVEQRDSDFPKLLADRMDAALRWEMTPFREVSVVARDENGATALLIRPEAMGEATDVDEDAPDAPGTEEWWLTTRPPPKQMGLTCSGCAHFNHNLVMLCDLDGARRTAGGCGHWLANGAVKDGGGGTGTPPRRTCSNCQHFNVDVCGLDGGMAIARECCSRWDGGP